MLSHPLRDVCYQNNRGPVVGTIDLLPEKKWKRTPLYHEIHRKLGLVHDTSMRFYMGFRCVIFTFCDTIPLGQEYYTFLNLIAPPLTPAHNGHTLGANKSKQHHNIAIDRYLRYKDDMQIMKEMGVTGYRASIA